MNYFLIGYSPVILFLLSIVAGLLVIWSREITKWIVCQFLVGFRVEGSKEKLPNLLDTIDPIGFIMILLTGCGWQKPLILPLRRLRKPRQGQIAIGIAGFSASILVFILASILIQTTSIGYLTYFYSKLMFFSIMLTTVNLFPLIPFDITYILAGIDYKKMYTLQNKRDQIQVLFLILVVFHIFSFLNEILFAILAR